MYNTYFIEKWHLRREQLNTCGKLDTYFTIKQNFGLEPYLTILKKFERRRSLTKFRISCHNLMIEKGRYYKYQERIEFVLTVHFVCQMTV